MKNIKHGEQISKLKSPRQNAKFGSQTLFVKIWRELQKGAEKKTREFCLDSYGVRGCAYHKTFNTAPATYLVKYLVNLFIYKQLLVQNGKTTASSKQTLMFQKQTTTREGLRTNGALACFETKSH